jgi:hypothetical protein
MLLRARNTKLIPTAASQRPEISLVTARLSSPSYTLFSSWAALNLTLLSQRYLLRERNKDAQFRCWQKEPHNDAKHDFQQNTAPAHCSMQIRNSKTVTSSSGDGEWELSPLTRSVSLRVTAAESAGSKAFTTQSKLRKSCTHVGSSDHDIMSTMQRYVRTIKLSLS